MDQSEIDKKAIKKGLAKSHDNYGGLHSMDKLNRQRPDQHPSAPVQDHEEGTERPLFGGIRFVS